MPNQSYSKQHISYMFLQKYHPHLSSFPQYINDKMKEHHLCLVLNKVFRISIACFCFWSSYNNWYWTCLLPKNSYKTGQNIKGKLWLFRKRILWGKPNGCIFLPGGNGSLVDLIRQRLEFLSSKVITICGAGSCMEMMSIRGSLDFLLWFDWLTSICFLKTISQFSIGNQHICLQGEVNLFLAWEVNASWHTWLTRMWCVPGHSSWFSGMSLWPNHCQPRLIWEHFLEPLGEKHPVSVRMT